MASARGEASESLVKLYKALGGGWDPSKVEPSERKSTEPKRSLEDSPEGKP